MIENFTSVIESHKEYKEIRKRWLGLEEGEEFFCSFKIKTPGMGLELTPSDARTRFYLSEDGLLEAEIKTAQNTTRVGYLNFLAELQSVFSINLDPEQFLLSFAGMTKNAYESQFVTEEENAHIAALENEIGKLEDKVAKLEAQLALDQVTTALDQTRVEDLGNGITVDENDVVRISVIDPLLNLCRDKEGKLPSLKNLRGTPGIESAKNTLRKTSEALLDASDSLTDFKPSLPRGIKALLLNTPLRGIKPHTAPENIDFSKEPTARTLRLTFDINKRDTNRGIATTEALAFVAEIKRLMNTKTHSEFGEALYQMGVTKIEFAVLKDNQDVARISTPLLTSKEIRELLEHNGLV